MMNDAVFNLTEQSANPGFERALAAWRGCAGFRATRERMKRFAYGRQWDDLVKHRGVTMTMGQRARRNYCEPVTNNLLRQIIKSVVGRFRSAAAGDCRRLSGGMKRIAEANLLDELDARTLEEFLISGCAVQRISREERPEGPGPWADMVSPSRFFVNGFRDPRGHDIEIIGMLHDWPLAETLMRLGRGDARRERMISRIYQEAADGAGLALFEQLAAPDGDFTTPSQPGRCRVIEVWTREYASATIVHDPETGLCSAALGDLPADEGNARRGHDGRMPVAMRRRRVALWRGRWYSPGGRLLAERTARRHPFAVKLYPLIDGEVHPFIEDIVDRQIQVNRTLTIVDRIMAVSAKELLLFPSEAVIGGNDWKLADYAKAWGRPGAVIPYKSASGAVPTVVNTAGINAGLSNLLGVELRMMEQVSGVSSALQGMKPDSGSTASLYAAQADNSAQTLRDIFDTFTSFRTQRNSLLTPKGI